MARLLAGHARQNRLPCQGRWPEQRGGGFFRRLSSSPRRSQTTAPPHPERRTVGSMRFGSFAKQGPWPRPVRPAVSWCPAQDPRPAGLAGRAGQHRKNHPGRAFPDHTLPRQSRPGAAQKLQPLPYRLIHIVGDQNAAGVRRAAATRPRSWCRADKARISLGVLNDHDRGVGHISADLDDGGRDQHIQLPRLNFCMTSSLFALA